MEIEGIALNKNDIKQMQRVLDGKIDTDSVIEKYIRRIKKSVNKIWIL